MIDEIIAFIGSNSFGKTAALMVLNCRKIDDVKEDVPGRCRIANDWYDYKNRI